MHTLLYYSTLAARDTLRPRAALAATAMIVLGVCLPLVLLLGLANGLVRQHEETMLRSPTALGAFGRRLRSRLGAPKAITGVAHKLAVLVDRMNLPRHSPDGQLMSYKFHHKASGRQLL